MAQRRCGEEESNEIACRTLLIRWSKKPENHLAFLHLACALVTWKTVITAPTGMGS